MPKNRLEAFSDGVFAIIITIIVLGMTLPASFTVANIQSFMWDIFIFIESGLIIGQFWYSHSQLLDQAKSISVVGVFLNILFLLVLSLVPLFTRGVMESPDSTSPIIGFVATILITSIIYQLLLYYLNDRNMRVDNWKFRMASFIFVIAIGVISFFSPRASSVLFIIFPIIGWIVKLMSSRAEIK
ncbi:DUF1211 domain-containing protein [Listeria booriae]|uniref:TMEM175 family protein n=1 Tax=Listeria booriae TaxID=1552123 RepID=UPI001629B52E|nr:TMEM175 family protein [Listeria booriae]MBC1896377.1 DUF1211 domain-containing protein [Listeria booriae]MBC2056126.1 DUF1211 domain-containing protein [Listeria booriae]